MAGNFWGKLVKDLRGEQGITQRKLAAACRVNRVMLRMIERGEKPGDMDVMERLLEFLGYELDAIVVRKSEARTENTPCHQDATS